MDYIAIYIILTAFLAAILYIFNWGIQRANYFKYNNVISIDVLPFIGNLKNILLKRRSAYEDIADIYFHKQVYNQPIVGFQLFHKPALLLLEPELIKHVLVKDFNLFANRHSKSDPHSDKMGNANLFLARNPFWRQIRARLTPTFTSGKLKNMLYLVKDVGNDLTNFLINKNISENTKEFIIDCRLLAARYTTDVIACCAFGVQANSIANPKSEFYAKGKCMFEFNFFRSIEFMSFFLLPQIVPYLKLKFFSTETENFLRDSIKDVMNVREKNGIFKNDLIDTLIQLKNEDKDKHSLDEVVFEGDILVAQAAIFFAAGYETTSSAISFALYELAMHQEYQTRLREEIKEKLQLCNDELTYDIIIGMEYLHMIVSETLRLYPTLPFLDRQCELPKDEKYYSLEPYHSFKMPSGMPVLIPIYAIQRDPKYFPEPLKFNPERFSPENKHLITPYTYLPFGTGPHSCIGDRLGLLEVKIGIISFLRNHYVLPTERTPKVMTFDIKAFTIQPESAVFLNVVKDSLM